MGVLKWWEAEAAEMGKSTQQCFIFHNRKRAEGMKPRKNKGAGARNASYQGDGLL